MTDQDEQEYSAQKIGTGVLSDHGLQITTRYADESDLAEVLAMYLAALDEIKDYVEPVDPDRCARTVLLSWAKAPCVLMEKLGKIIGFAGLRTALPAHSVQPILTEYMFFIKPEFRSTEAAKTLSDAVKAVADKFHMNLRMTHMVFDRPLAAKEKFLRAWGYDIMAFSVLYKGA